jgi:hypothetical protein
MNTIRARLAERLRQRFFVNSCNISFGYKMSRTFHA